MVPVYTGTVNLHMGGDDDMKKVKNPMAVQAKAMRPQVVKAKKGKGSYSRKGLKNGQ